MTDWNNYKLIVSDFDNTLVTSDLKIEPRLKEAIQQIRQQGFGFSIATGRHRFGTLEEAVDDLDLSEQIISRGGAEISDPKSGELIWHSFIDQVLAKNLVAYLLGLKIPFTVEKENFIFCQDYKSSSSYAKGLVVKKVQDLNFDSISKFVLRPKPESIGELEEKINNDFNQLHLTKALSRQKNIILDVTAGNASKHLAVLELSKLLNIQPSQIIGIGDSYNDYPLLSACGYKVATADAPEELKEIADEIIPTAGENGVADFLEKIITIAKV